MEALLGNVDQVGPLGSHKALELLGLLVGLGELLAGKNALGIAEKRIETKQMQAELRA